MLKTLKDQIIQTTRATDIGEIQLVQSLWSGFGAVERVPLKGGDYTSIIIKRITPPTKMNHPRGWNSDVSAQRKIKSYQIEKHWYQHFVPQLPSNVKVPRLLFSEEFEDQTVLVMEDLSALNYNLSYNSENEEHFNACLLWLARFHAFHLNPSANGLWKVGTYWHLETRQEEFESMNSGSLKKNASAIDHKLKTCTHQTIVHGDAKPANFCFNSQGQVAAVDFQYVGKGCGMKDLVYLMSSALSEQELFANDKDIVERYFLLLKEAIEEQGHSSVNFIELKEEWSRLYVTAWLDFLRFLDGWSPKHDRKNAYTRQLLYDLVL